jgi:hypothetical protein
MVSEILVSNATLEQTLLNAKTALLDAVMEFWNLEKSATMVSTTQTLWQMVAEPTAVFHLVVMEFSMLWRNAMLELPIPIHQTAVEPGAVCPSVVMALLILEERNPVMTATLLMGMVATHAANLNAEMDALILESNVMLELEIQTLSQLAAAPTADSLFVVMVLPTSVRSATMERPMFSDPTPADLTVPYQNVVMVSLTIFMAKFVTTDQETPGPASMDVHQHAHPTFAAKALLLTQLLTLLTGSLNKLECTTTKVLTLMLLILRTSTTSSLQLLRQFLHASWLNSEKFRPTMHVASKLATTDQ